MRADGCHAPGLEVHVKRICMMDTVARDPHKFFVPIQLAPSTKCPIYLAPTVYYKGHTIRSISVAEHSNWVQVDVHWDNYNHPPTRERMSVCAWCYSIFMFESYAETYEEVLATQYLINQREVPRSCLTR